MQKLEAVTPVRADSEIREIYADILRVFNLGTVPYYFQIIANFPEFLKIVWEKIRPVLSDPKFYDSYEPLVARLTASLVSGLPGTGKIASLTAEIPDTEKRQMSENFAGMVESSLKLTVAAITVREAIKKWDIAHGPAALPGGAPLLSGHTEADTRSEVLFPGSELSGGTSRASYDYMQLMSEVLAEMSRSPKFLEIRLELEQTVQKNLSQNPVELSYQEISRAVYDRPGVNELVYLIHDLFPGLLPKQLLGALLLMIGLTVSRLPEIGR